MSARPVVICSVCGREVKGRRSAGRSKKAGKDVFLPYPHTYYGIDQCKGVTQQAERVTV